MDAGRSIISIRSGPGRRLELFLSLLGFAFVTTITPGPNNFMVLASGANFGFRRTIPHMLGISIGFPLMVVAIGLGIGGFLDRLPELHRILKFVAFAYLLWLAFHIARASDRPPSGAGSRPLSFLGAAAFQWVNPKAWAMALGVVPLYTTTGGNHLAEIGIIAFAFALVCLPSCGSWCLFGTAIAHHLERRAWRRRFNYTMAALLVVSVIPALFV